MSTPSASWVPAGPVRGKALWIPLSLLAPFLVALGVLEARNGSGLPVAALLSGIVAYAGLCVFQLEAAFLLLCVTTPFSLEMAMGGGNRLQIPTEPMLFVALTAWGFRFLARGTRRVAEPLLVGLLLLGLGTCLLSLVDAAHRVNGMKATVNAVWYALYGLFLLNNVRSEGRLKALAASFLVPGLVVTVVSLTLVAMGRYNPADGLWRFKPCFTEHGSFAAYLSFVLALLLGLALELRGRMRVFLWAAAFLVALQVVLSLTRGAWLGMGALALFLGALYWRRLLHPLGLTLVGAFVTLFVLILVQTGVLDRLQDYSETTFEFRYTSNLERVNRWGAGWRMFQTDPLTGVGFGTYPDLYNDYRSIPLGTDQSHIRMGIHSEYFKIPVETGLIGTVVALAVCVVVVRMAAQAVRDARTPLLRGMAVGLAGGLVTYMVHGWVNNYLVFDKVAVPLWAAVGGLGAIRALARERLPRVAP